MLWETVRYDLGGKTSTEKMHGVCMPKYIPLTYAQLGKSKPAGHSQDASTKANDSVGR